MNEEAARAELARLKVKRREIQDKDIRAALDSRIQAVEAQLAAIPKPEPVSTEEGAPAAVNVREPTPQELADADKLIALARLETNRGNKSKATDLMKQAAELAPGSPTVLESLGDDLVERKQWKGAKEAYAKAHALAPKNVGIERKLANAALKSAGIGSIEDQLRAGLSESNFLNESDAVAGRTAAVIMSAFVPGLGHIVLGRTATGAAILTAWIVLGLWVTAMRKDVEGMIAMVTGRPHSSPNFLVMLPIVLMILIWVVTLNALTDKRKAVRRKIDHPAPPVDMPFE